MLVVTNQTTISELMVEFARLGVVVSIIGVAHPPYVVLTSVDSSEHLSSTGKGDTLVDAFNAALSSFREKFKQHFREAVL